MGGSKVPRGDFTIMAGAALQAARIGETFFRFLKIMGVYQCNRHGRQAVELVCTHIAQSILAGQFLSSELVLENRLLGNVRLCASCKPRFEANKSAEWDPVLDDLKPCCSACFDEWSRSA
jgi:hypothetical protein